MLRLLLVRHGQTDWNAQRRYQGFSDLPLNEKGLEQAHQLAERLQTQQFDLIFSSDLQRAHQTAQILVGLRETRIQSDPLLREMNFGLLEGHTFDEALQRWPAMIETWLQDNNQPPEGAERIDQFNERVARFYHELIDSALLNQPDQKTVLIVAHGGPLREIIRLLLRAAIPTSPAWWFNLEHASLSEFQVEPEHVIINRLNDTGHLRN